MRALTPEQIDILVDKYIIGLYQEMEREIIVDIARRVKKTGRYTETAELMAKSMVEQGYSASKIQAEVMKLLRADKAYQMAVAENTKAYKRQVQEIIDKTLEEANKGNKELIAEAANMAWNNDLSMWQEHGVDLKEPNTMGQLMTALQIQTAKELKNITRTTGFKNTVLGTTGVLNAYQKELDLAALKIASGTFSYDQAVNDCVKRLAVSGLRSIDYANGRSYQIDTAVRMAARTGVSQLSGRITEMNLKSTGQDLVIVSQHMGSRPEHAPIQNKVFSYSGKNKKYPSFQAPIGSGGAGYGMADGIKGVNCTHDFYPYWEGDAIPKDIEYDERYYKNTQKQRAMERNIRATKREIEAQKAIGGDTKELQAKLRKQVSDYHSFSDSVGIRAKDNRLRVASSTSDLRKTKAYKNAVKMTETRITGALNKKNDPLGRKMRAHSELYYEEMRNRKQGYIIKKMSKNANISENAAKDIYQHIFIKEHIFQDGSVKRFDPDYHMAESFRRILEGKDIKPHDIVMLKHEKLELSLMKKYNMVYEEAHSLAETKYSYNKALNDFLKELGS